MCRHAAERPRSRSRVYWRNPKRARNGMESNWRPLSISVCVAAFSSRKGLCVIPVVCPRGCRCDSHVPAFARGCRGPLKTPPFILPAAHLLELGRPGEWRRWPGGCRWWRGRAGAWTPWMCRAPSELRESRWYSGGDEWDPAVDVVARAHLVLSAPDLGRQRSTSCGLTWSQGRRAYVQCLSGPLCGPLLTYRNRRPPVAEPARSSSYGWDARIPAPSDDGQIHSKWPWRRLLVDGTWSLTHRRRAYR